MRKNFKNIILALLSTAVLIGLLELTGLWLIKYKNLSFSEDGAELVYRKPGNDFGLLPYELRPYFTGREWNTNFSVNSFGFRGKEFNPIKPAGVVRILSLGDSCTFGTGRLEDQDTYPELLEKSLNKRFGAGVFEVINVGMPGYTVYQGFILAKQRNLVALRPDLVIICYGWNDHERFARADRFSSYQALVKNFLLKYFAFYKYLYYSYRGGSMRPELDLPKRALRVNPHEYEYYLSRLISLFQDNNIKVIVMTAPWEPRLMKETVGWLRESTLESFFLHLPYVDLTKKVCLKKKARLVDLYALFEFKKTNDPSKYFIDPFHYNQAGSAYIASKLNDTVAVMLEGRIKEQQSVKPLAKKKGLKS